MPGCGKSTTAQFLAAQLRRAGHRARWRYEEETPHPVFRARYEGPTWDGYFADRRDRWAAFVASVESSNEVVILESVLLQTPIMTTLREGVAADAILAHLARVQASLLPLSPLLVYLRHPRPDEVLLSTLAKRGPRWEAHHVQGLATTWYAAARGVSGVSGLLAYWREHAELVERAVAASPLSTLVVDVTRGDWDERRRAILKPLAVSFTPDATVPEASLRRLVGRYRGGAATTRECVITLREGRLVLEGFFWPANPLLPSGPDTFEAESWPFELRFERDDGEAVRRMRLSGPPLGWGRVDGVYERLTQ